MSDDQPNDEQRQRLEEVVSGFDTAMLVTTAEGLIRARPMHISARRSDTELWFLSSRDTTKVEEIEEDFRAAVVMQDKRKFACLSGMVSIKDDTETLEELWSLGMKPWFPDGPASDDLIAIRFVPLEGEYWDTSGTGGLVYVFKAAKAVLLGEALEVDSPQTHGSVSL